ncbi:alanine/glycine:cation symporter family protein [Salinactinospora qingdaonensis]|uniref:Alanine/glycine:cation symporter family protein n=1 Tax=Salinactinospora qingdaonensis TaxID=702744 RepID=A0ABP7GFU6_9ACTN
MDAVNALVETCNDVVWGYLVIPLLVALSSYLTVRSGVVQVRLLPAMFTAMRGGSRGASGGERAVSSFQAFAISAAARVGTGNVAGVAIAIGVGGPGAVLWMWLMGLLVGSTSFVESTLAQMYKVRDRSGFRGGSAYYMRYGLNANWAGVIFAVASVVTFGSVFTTVQSNAIATAVASSVDVTGASVGTWLAPAVGGGLTAVTALVVVGGVRWIALVAQALVPGMALLYLLLGATVIAGNLAEVPGVVAEIFAHALGLGEVAAGAVGTAVVQGIRRGMFSNEAGMGSVPNAAAGAAVSHPAKQGLAQTLGVYVDTLVVCSTTAFVVLLADPTYGPHRAADLTQQALALELGPWSLHVLTVIIVLLAFTSLLGNYYYGAANIAFLAAGDGVMATYRWAFLLMTFVGAIGSVQVVWSLADTAMGVMAVLNLVALIPLSGVALRLLDDYTRQRRQGRDPVFTRDRLAGVSGVRCWEPGGPPEAEAPVPE